ncbi:MAG: 3'-5' exonuclease [Chloroflexi bacterium]|nr:3'-5' exonuclease [Chloroflexota bacterium]
MSAYRQAIDRKVAAHEAHLLLQNDFLILDTETTGIDRAARIVQIAVVDASGQPAIDTLINPGMRIPADATRIHGITNAMVKEAPSMADLLPSLESLWSTRPTYIYNAEFDVRMLLQHIGRRPGMMRSTCVMKLYARFVGQTGSYGDYKWHKLTDACTQLRIPKIDAPAHSALGDCLRTLAVLRAMSEWYVRNSA